MFDHAHPPDPEQVARFRQVDRTSSCWQPGQVASMVTLSTTKSRLILRRRGDGDKWR